MNATLELDVSAVDEVNRAVTPSLRDSNTVSYTVVAEDTFNVTVRTPKLGALRGATSTALMLTKLSTTILSMED